MSNKLYLRAFEMEDLAVVHRLRNDDALFQTTGGNKFYTSLERNRAWLGEKMLGTGNQLYLALCTVSDDELIGYVCALNIDYMNRKAEWGGIILDSTKHSAGYGEEAGMLLTLHLFGQMGMNMVYGFIKEDNVASVRMAEKIGFVKWGFIEDYVYKNFRYFGGHMLGMTKAQFLAKHEAILQEKELIR